MRIGIFEGKKACYNRKILKLLVEKQPLKAWDIAKHIAKGEMSRTQDIYAVLIRKNGRLNELLEKQYIKMLPDKCYIPTFKGIIAYASSEKNPRISKAYKEILSSAISQLPEQLTVPLFGFKVATDFYKEQIEKVKFTEEELIQLAKFIEESLPWIDLDAVGEEEISALILLKLMSKNKQIIEEFKEIFAKFFKVS